MREVVVYELLSLDGVAERPDRFFDWDGALDANLAAVIGRQDAVVLGRRSYEEWASYWPSSDIEPFATFINTVSKHVATSRPLEPAWTGATAVDGDLVAFVKHLKEQPGGDIGVHAGISVAQALLAAGVVDRLQLVVSPVLAGTGRRLLDAVPTTRLELVASTAAASGHLVLDYRVLGGAASGPPPRW